MHCEEVKALLDRGLQGGLDLQESRDLQEHVARCEGCRAAHDHVLRFLAAVEGGPEGEPPPGFADRVMARVRAESRGPAGFFPSWPQVAFAVATVAALGILVLAVPADGMTDAFSRAYLLPAGRLQALLADGADALARLPGAGVVYPSAGLLCVALMALATRLPGSAAHRGKADDR